MTQQNVMHLSDHYSFRKNSFISVDDWPALLLGLSAHRAPILEGIGPLPKGIFGMVQNTENLT